MHPDNLAEGLMSYVTAGGLTLKSQKLHTPAQFY